MKDMGGAALGLSGNDEASSEAQVVKVAVAEF
jgi:hypothetical protein